jgi:predicted 3-demethylubiquinone-9 3-methyltransferase (glyoxalase superfamily)
MQIVTQKIAPCLWYDTEAEDAAKFYVSIFKNSKITTIARYPEMKARRSMARRLAR